MPSSSVNLISLRQICFVWFQCIFQDEDIYGLGKIDFRIEFQSLLQEFQNWLKLHQGPF